MNNISKIGITAALLFMVSELSYINSKSLIYLAGNTRIIDIAFSILGSLAFSIVTILVMRNSVIKWPKLVFPLFDAALVFLGFNLPYAEAIINGNDNQVRFYLTVFMAGFTGLITYSLGIINYRTENTKEQIQLQQLKASFNEAGKKLDDVRAKLQQSRAELQQKNEQLEQVNSQRNQNTGELQQLKADLQQSREDLQQAKKSLLHFEKACTCPYCNEVFQSEAAKRSHMGRCKDKPNTEPCKN